MERSIIDMQPGDQFPDIELPNSKGGTTRLSDAYDKGDVIVGILPQTSVDEWLAAAQPYTVKWLLDDFANVYLVLRDATETAKRLADEHGIQFGFLCDTAGTIQVAPGFYRLDESGHVKKAAVALEELQSL